MVFIDTGAFIAKYIKSDKYHEEALQKWNTIIGTVKLYTSNHIINETITLLMRKTHPNFAVEKAKILYQTKILEILHICKYPLEIGFTP